MRVAFSASAHGEFASWRDATLSSEGRIDADDSRALLRLFALDRAFAVAHSAGALSWKALGSPSGDLRLQGTLALAGLESGIAATLRSAPDGVSGQSEFSVRAADAAVLRRPLGRAGPAPLALKTLVRISPQRYVFEQLAGSVAGSPFCGRLSFTRDLGALDGQIDTEFLDVSALVAAMLGVPAGPAAQARQRLGRRSRSANASSPVSTARSSLSAKRAAFTPAFEVRQARGRAALLRRLPRHRRHQWRSCRRQADRAFFRTLEWAWRRHRISRRACGRRSRGALSRRAVRSSTGRRRHSARGQRLRPQPREPGEHAQRRRVDQYQRRRLPNLEPDGVFRDRGG